MSGGFVSNGSTNRPVVDIEPDTVLQIKAVPKNVAETLINGHGGAASGIKITTDASVSATSSAGSSIDGAGKQAADAFLAAATGSAGASAATNSNTRAGRSQGAQGGAAAPTFDDLHKGQKAQYLVAQNMIKALGLRASQLPKDAVTQVLAACGLKFKG